MRWLTVLATLVAAACLDVTAVAPDRLPPPDREEIDDGRLADPTDPCGALDVGPPQRLSATPGDSDGVRMAVLQRQRSEPWIAVAWVEHGLVDPLVQFPSVDVQVLLADGVRFGDVIHVGAQAPTAIDVAPIPDQDAFVVVVDDQVDPFAIGVAPNTLPFGQTSVLDVDGMSVVALPDGALVAGIAREGRDGPRPVAVTELISTGDMVATGQTFWLEDVAAEAVVLTASGTETWLAWADRTHLVGATVEYAPGAGTLTLGARASKNLTVSKLRRVQGAPSLTTSVEDDDQLWVLRMDTAGWQQVLGEYSLDPDGGDAAVARGESGTRWALARSVRPYVDTQREIRIERFGRDDTPCRQATDCLTLTDRKSVV